MVRWTYTSKLDLLEIYKYISRDSVYYAKKVVNDILDKSEYLESFPGIGKKVEEFDDDNLREIIIYSYRIVYRVADSMDIYVLAIVHCKRTLTEGMLDEKL